MIYAVICRTEKGVWMPAPEGVFMERRLALNYIECKKAAGSSLVYAIVAG